MDPLNLILRQLELEGIGLDDDGRLARIPSAEADEIPRVYVTRHDRGFHRFYRGDLPEATCRRLDLLDEETFFEDRARVQQILARHAPCLDTWIGASYVVVDPPPARAFLEVRRLDGADRSLVGQHDAGLLRFGRPIYAVVVAGQIASSCVSVRENASAAEAWVQTAAAFRRRGFARQVTAAWAHDVRSAGKVAFYSHARDNAASLGVARSLGLAKFIDAVGYL